jgi:hypothetical protein
LRLNGRDDLCAQLADGSGSSNSGGTNEALLLQAWHKWNASSVSSRSRAKKNWSNPSEQRPEEFNVLGNLGQQVPVAALRELMQLDAGKPLVTR